MMEPQEIEDEGHERILERVAAIDDLGGPRPGGMTVAERPAWHLPGPCATSRAAGRWPSPDPVSG